MQAILAVTVPFFALVLAGRLAARQRVLPEAAIPGLNAYVLYFALPCPACCCVLAPTPRCWTC